MRNRLFYRVIGIIALTCVLFTSVLTAAELRFARHFGDGMVIQRDKPAQINGFADKGAKITVAFARQSKTAAAGDDGAWSVTLDAMPANANGQELTATVGKLKSSVGNVLVGDVFLARRTS